MADRDEQTFVKGVTRKLRRQQPAMDGESEVSADTVVEVLSGRKKKGPKGMTWTYVLAKVGNADGDLSGILELSHWGVKHHTRAISNPKPT